MRKPWGTLAGGICARNCWQPNQRHVCRRCHEQGEGKGDTQQLRVETDGGEGGNDEALAESGVQTDEGLPVMIVKNVEDALDEGALEVIRTIPVPKEVSMEDIE